ncbi:MAG: hypothetical protein QOD06_1270 [Candidatus Binatota bacterium]|nr:hypothetical protein [Candidatus Binatota bacterium]
MDLRLTEQEERFRSEFSRWLDENLPIGWGSPELRSRATMEDEVAFARSWQRTLHDGGWAGISWPKEYGGRGAPLVEQVLFHEEYARRRAPNLITLGVGVPIVGPTLMTHGTAPQKARFLPRILTGEDLWCQGFSEPGSGSDLASLRTRGDVSGDDVIVTGQKIWTSYAVFADWCILLARTDANAPKHGGISYLLVDMKSPGITIRPLREMTGRSWFNEVFFDAVRVPRENVVGALNQGWQITMMTLGHERSVSAPHTRLLVELEDVIRMAKRRSPSGRIEDPSLRQRLASHWVDAECLRCSAYRTVTRTMKSGRPGPEGSILKLFWSELDQRVKETAIQLQGPQGLLAEDSPRAADEGRWQYELLWSRAATIYAGTSEVQRNIVALRILGLPRG